MPSLLTLKRTLVQKLTHTNNNKLHKRPRPISTQRWTYEGHNLSTIEEDIEPLLPDDPKLSSRPDSVSSGESSLFPGKLSDDPIIAKFVVEVLDREKQDDERRCSMKIPVEDVETPPTESVDDEKTALQQQLQTTQTELTQTLTTLHAAENSFNTYHTRASNELTHHQHTISTLHHEISTLKAHLSSLTKTKNPARKRLTDKILELNTIIESLQVVIENKDKDLRDLQRLREGRETRIRWLEEDVQKLGRENKALARKAELLSEQVGKLKRERARRDADEVGEEDVFYT